MIASLRAYEQNPKNPNPDQTRRQVRGLMEDTFRIGYGSTEYIKFAPTSKGTVKVKS
ncbi:MAG: hypothetical protein H7Z41_15195 [Cytophagales bacterium]|nr:hypothetical protein [Armatimonadota bacterium]